MRIFTGGIVCREQRRAHTNPPLQLHHIANGHCATIVLEKGHTRPGSYKKTRPRHTCSSCRSAFFSISPALHHTVHTQHQQPAVPYTHTAWLFFSDKSVLLAFVKCRFSSLPYAVFFAYARFLLTFNSLHQRSTRQTLWHDGLAIYLALTRTSSHTYTERRRDGDCTPKFSHNFHLFSRIFSSRRV